MHQLAIDVQALAGEAARDAERRRIVGVILNEVGLRRLAGQHTVANALDALATKVEHPEHG